MGGSGSGRLKHVRSKLTTEDYRSLDVRDLQRKGLLNPGLNLKWQWIRRDEVIADIGIRSEVDRIILTYRHMSSKEDWRDMCYPVYLEYTACNYGGQRAWFLCPVAGCGRRVAMLYGSRIFTCRHCLDLVYACQREHDADSLARKANKLRVRLGWGMGILNGTGQKPKGMRWRSYDRFYAEHQVLVQNTLQQIGKILGISKW